MTNTHAYKVTASSTKTNTPRQTLQ